MIDSMINPHGVRPMNRWRVGVEFVNPYQLTPCEYDADEARIENGVLMLLNGVCATPQFQTLVIAFAPGAWRTVCLLPKEPK